MKVITLVALCFCSLLVQSVAAQDRLSLNQPVVRNLEPGSTHTLSISLQDGEFVTASLTQHGRVNVFVLNTQGLLMRRFVGPSMDGKRQFTFAADGAGEYTLQISTPAAQSAKYELLVDKVESLNDRLKPQPWNDPYPSP